MSEASPPRDRGDRPPREEIPPEADEVLPYLYLGNLNFVRKPELVFELGITHILNLTRHSVPKEVCAHKLAISLSWLQRFILILTSKAFQEMPLHRNCSKGTCC